MRIGIKPRFSVVPTPETLSDFTRGAAITTYISLIFLHLHSCLRSRAADSHRREKPLASSNKATGVVLELDRSGSD